MVGVQKKKKKKQCRSGVPGDIFDSQDMWSTQTKHQPCGSVSKPYFCKLLSDACSKQLCYKEPDTSILRGKPGLCGTEGTAIQRAKKYHLLLSSLRLSTSKILFAGKKTHLFAFLCNNKQMAKKKKSHLHRKT